MTNEQAHAEHAQYPHMLIETIAYYAGRNSIGDGGEVWYSCEFTESKLVEAFKRGVREVRSENRLNADTEWDQD